MGSKYTSFCKGAFGGTGIWTSKSNCPASKTLDIVNRGVLTERQLNLGFIDSQRVSSFHIWADLITQTDPIACGGDKSGGLDLPPGPCRGIIGPEIIGPEISARFTVYVCLYPQFLTGARPDTKELTMLSEVAAGVFSKGASLNQGSVRVSLNFASEVMDSTGMSLDHYSYSADFAVTDRLLNSVSYLNSDASSGVVSVLMMSVASMISFLS
jgi:hypothetical protein